MQLLFEYDPRKAAANLRKHSVSFTDAMSVSNDPLASTLRDDQHSQDEARFITAGNSARDRLLFVVYTQAETRIRPIGARLATKRERQQYEEGH